MTQIDDLIKSAKSQLGKPYIFGYEVDLNNSNPPAFDCSEYIQFIIYQATKNKWTDGARNQYNASTKISLIQAIKTKGALLFKKTVLGMIYHVGISLGDGTVINAKSKKYGVVIEKVDKSWTHGGLIPVIDYLEKKGELTMSQYEELIKRIDGGLLNLQTNINKIQNEAREFNLQRFKEIERLNNEVNQLKKELIEIKNEN